MDKLKNKKIQLGGIILLVVILPVVLLLIKSVQDIRQRASGGTISLSSTIPSGTRTVGESFFSDVVFDTQGNNVTAFDITLNYDKSILNATGVVATTPFTLITGQTSTPGTVRFTAISKTPVNGIVTVGKISFQALKAGSSTNSYSNIQVAAFGSGSTNITSNQASTTVTVGSGATATPTIAATSCVGGIANCANSDGSNYSCNGTKIYNDNPAQDAWCKNNGGAGSREYCYKCITSSTPPTACTFSSSNNISVIAGVSKSFSINATNLQSGTTSVGFTSGTDKLFKDYNNTLPFNSTMNLTTTNSTYTNSTSGGNQSFNFTITTSAQTQVGEYTLDAIYLSNSGSKTQCIYSGLGGLVVNVSAPQGTKTCYKDADGDGFGNAAGGTQTNQSACASGWSLTNNDCYDSNPSVNPSQTGYFGVQRGDGSFDYNCNGTAEKKYAKNSFSISQTATCVATMPSGTVGFTNETACGISSTFRLCYKWGTSACGGADTASAKAESIGQTCPVGASGNGWALIDGGSVEQQCK